MFYYIMDLEFNQYYDFHDDCLPEPACPSEIIQMGIVVMDANFNIKRKNETLVKPQIFTRLHPHVQRITGLSMEDLEEAPPFPEAFEQFFSFAFGKRAVFCTWGSEDVKELYRNILYYSLNHKSLTRRYLNVQRLYGKCRNVNDGTSPERQVGLKAAVENAGINISKPFHDALSDAEYTAEVFKYLLGNKAAAPHVQVQSLNIGDLKHSISGRVNSVNINLLFTHTERLMQKKLSDRDKEMILEIYNCGRDGRFDLHRKRT